jgi:hypothetical protein
VHHAEILFVHMCWDNMSLHPFLTNLEDEISVKGGRICKAQNVCIKKYINNKVNTWRNKIASTNISNYTWESKFENGILKAKNYFDTWKFEVELEWDLNWEIKNKKKKRRKRIHPIIYICTNNYIPFMLAFIFFFTLSFCVEFTNEFEFNY